MIIHNVSISNIDTLFNMVSDYYEQKDFVDKFFGNNLPSVYSNISVNMNISSLSFIEYYHLKHMMQENSVTEFVENDPNIQYINSVFPEISDKARMLKRTNSAEIFKMIIPAGCIDGSCNLKITGKDLSIFFGYDPMREFFVPNVPSDKLQNDDRTFNREYVSTVFKDGIVTDTYIENKFIQIFLSYFYKNMIKTHDYVDILSDFVVNKYYYSNELIKIINVDDRVILNKGDFGTVDEIKKSIANKHTDLLNECTLTFTLNSNFYTFLNLYNKLPKNSFVNIESLRIPHSVLHENINNENGNNLFKAINDSYNVRGQEIKYASMIPNCSNIHYIIKLTLNDINHYSSKLLQSGNNSQLENIGKQIIKFGRLFYNTLSE